MRQTVSLKKQYQIVDDLLVQRIHKLLPELMEETGYDMWIILCREYNEDPVFTTMLPSLCLTARRLSCLVFVNNESGFSAYNFGRPDERLSTVAAERALLEADTSRKRRAEVIDQVAAGYILQGALDRLRFLG